MRLIMERLCCDEQTEGGLSGDDNVYLLIFTLKSTGKRRAFRLPGADAWDFDSDEDDPQHCRVGENILWESLAPGESVAVHVHVREEDASPPSVVDMLNAFMETVIEEDPLPFLIEWSKGVYSTLINSDDYIGSFQLVVKRAADGALSTEWYPGIGTEHIEFGDRHEFRMRGDDGDVNYVGTFHVSTLDAIKIIPNPDPTIIEGEATASGGDFDAVWAMIGAPARIPDWLPLVESASPIGGDRWRLRLRYGLPEVTALFARAEKPGLRKLAFDAGDEFSGYVVLKRGAGALLHLKLRNHAMQHAQLLERFAATLRRAGAALCG